MGENPLCHPLSCVRYAFSESRSSEMERKWCGKFHLKLNSGLTPIANKYHEGKVKRTLKRELKVLEIAEREAKGISHVGQIASQEYDGLPSQRKRGGEFRMRSVQCFWPCLSASLSA